MLDVLLAKRLPLPDGRIPQLGTVKAIEPTKKYVH